MVACICHWARMRVAIVHEMLIKHGWAENVLLDLLRIFPQAHVYTMIYDRHKIGHIFHEDHIHVTPLTQNVYRIFRKARLCLPFMRKAVESIDLSEYDLVISSSSGFAHGCITWAKTRHIVYYHSPARYLWDATHEVQTNLGSRLDRHGFPRPQALIVGALFSHGRIWDYQAAQRHDITIANSHEVARRIEKYYRREADQVIYPGVDIGRFEAGKQDLSEREYYVTWGALTPFKRHDLTIEAFNKLGLSLKIFGSGDQKHHLKKIAHKNISFLGRISDEEQVKLYKKARWFIISNKEDFGIAPIEAMAAGIPVFAFGEWWALETVSSGEYGRLFYDQSVSWFLEWFKKFHKEIDAWEYDSEKLKKHAHTFSRATFLKSFEKLIKDI